MSHSSIPFSAYTNGYIEHAWANKDTLSIKQKVGFMGICLVVINSFLEGHCVDFLKTRLNFLDSSTNAALSQNPITYNFNRENCKISLSHDAKLLKRHKEQLKKELDRATFGKRNELHKTIYGESLKELIGNEGYEIWESLAKLRNLIGHGRDFVCYDSGNRSEPDLTFTNTQLQEVARILNKHSVMGDHSEINGAFKAFKKILGENTVKFYHKTAESILVNYANNLDPSFSILQRRTTLPKLN